MASFDQHIWLADNGDGTYRNPILHADYSDPDAIRTGADYFLVASSFNSVPGVPVLHSYDLVNWKIINHVIGRIPFPEYSKPQHGRGVWAPSIRFHNSKYYVYIPLPDEGIFMSTAVHPAAEWSPPVCVRDGQGWIDPCPFWDDDGRAYLVNAFAYSRIGVKSMLHLSPMHPDGSVLLGEGKCIFDGTATHPTIEGPKLYKRNGWYYIFAPAGGVPAGWQAVLRSRNIWGPYEDKIVLHQGSTAVNGPHQGALVDTQNGEWWFLHFQDAGAFGRISHLQPVWWEDDWPVIGINQDSQGRGEPVMKYKKPDVGRIWPVYSPVVNDDFSGNSLGLQWQWEANPEQDWYTCLPSEKKLRLHAQAISPDMPFCIRNHPAVLCQKFPARLFTVETCVALHADIPGAAAGLAVLGNAYAYIVIEKQDKDYRIRFCTKSVSVDTAGSVAAQEERHLCAEEVWVDGPRVNSGTIWFRLNVDYHAQCRFSWSADGNMFRMLGDTFSASPGRWVGAKIGLFAIKNLRTEISSYADFGYFTVREL
ncbi:MAG: glycoside hydrolase 43 family protein [Spirochaetales bacterium]|nr:glycoside hydrolase 43 family protein [Spirochaetales bacterium]